MQRRTGGSSQSHASARQPAAATADPAASRQLFDMIRGGGGTQATPAASSSFASSSATSGPAMHGARPDGSQMGDAAHAHSQIAGATHAAHGAAGAAASRPVAHSDPRAAEEAYRRDQAEVHTFAQQRIASSGGQFPTRITYKGATWIPAKVGERIVYLTEERLRLAQAQK